MKLSTRRPKGGYVRMAVPEELCQPFLTIVLSSSFHSSLQPTAENVCVGKWIKTAIDSGVWGLSSAQILPWPLSPPGPWDS